MFEAGKTTANHTFNFVSGAMLAEEPEYFTVELRVPQNTGDKGIGPGVQSTARINIIDGMKLLSMCTHVFMQHVDSS